MKTKRAFSLLEILVVASILLLLWGILVLSLNRGRESSYNAICVSNLRKLAIGFTTYISDHNGSFMPYAEWHGTRGVMPPGGGAINSWVEVLLNSEYVESPLVFVCPALLEGGRKFIPDAGGKLDYTYAHYGYNYQHLGGSTRYKEDCPPQDDNVPSSYINYIPARIDQITNPANTLVLVDSFEENAQGKFQGRYIVRDTPRDYKTYQVHPRHNHAMNILFADWHVSRLETNGEDPWEVLKYDNNGESLFRRYPK